jgi:hypothetical protein
VKAHSERPLLRGGGSATGRYSAAEPPSSGCSAAQRPLGRAAAAQRRGAASGTKYGESTVY